MITGQQLTPTLRLSRLLGQGGMGSVWVADHLGLGTQVAVKFMSPAFAQHPEFVERFRREAMAAAQLKSPHVAQVFDHGVTADGSPYIVMELLEGEELKRRVKRLGPLPPVEVARIVAQAAKALGRAHHLGIIHRDIKPDNLFLLDVEGEIFVKVLDFGVAKLAVEGNLGMTVTGNMMGTPRYMSPEQILSAKHVDLRADLWSLAVVAYFALTGRVPFTGENIGALAVAINSGVFELPSAVQPGLLPAIDAWMQRALQHDPAARFSSAKELALALEVAVYGVARGSMPSAGDLAAPASTPPAALVDTGGGSGGTPNHDRLSGSGEQSRSLAAVEAAGNDVMRRSPAVISVAAVIAVLATIGAGVVLSARHAPADTGSLAPRAAASTAWSPSSNSATIEGSAAGIVSAAAPTSAPSAPPLVQSIAPPAPPLVSTKALATTAYTSTAPAPARATAAPKPGRASKPAGTKDTIGF